MDKRNVVYIQTTKYFSAVKREELLTYAATWTNLEKEFSEKSQTTRLNIPRFHLHEIPRKGKTIQIEGRSAGDWE